LRIKNIDVEITNNATFYSETNLKIDKVNYNVCVGETRDNKSHLFYGLTIKLYQVELEKEQQRVSYGYLCKRGVLFRLFVKNR